MQLQLRQSTSEADGSIPECRTEVRFGSMECAGFGSSTCCSVHVADVV